MATSLRHAATGGPSGSATARAAPIASHWPVYADDEIAAAVAVLASGRVNALHHGARCAAFERAFAILCGQPCAVAVANGTLALELALRALGIGAGDEVIVPARSFMATASCVVACGATPIFADVDPITQGLSAGTVAPLIGPGTRAVIAVHIGGHPAAVDDVARLCARHRLKLIEDCAQAHGATLDGRPVGGFGDAAAFSFCTDKIVSTGGEGGMLVLRDPAVADLAWSLKDHGKDRASIAAPVVTRGFRWLHRRFGSNYRLTEMQAAIGCVQLAKLPGWTRARRRNAEALLAELEGCATLRIVRPAAIVGHAYYKFYAFVRPEALRPGWSRDRLLQEAQDDGLPCQTGTCPEMYRERAFVDAGIGPRRALPVARVLGETSLMLPVDQTLDEDSCGEMGRRLRRIADRGAL